METTPHPHDTSRFQLERLILFSDAVFAIAITLLIIEIKVPHFVGTFTDADVAHALTHQGAEWIGFFISFWVIGIYWMAHHRMFGYVVRYSDGLAFVNLLFLMTIVIMPFSSALYSQYSRLNTPFVFYCLNVGMTGFCLLFIWRYINNPTHQVKAFIAPLIREHAYVRNLVAPLIFQLAAIAAITLPGPWVWLSRCLFFLIFPIQMILGRIYGAKLKADREETAPAEVQKIDS
jgi:uncharacterized membrane protein